MAKPLSELTDEPKLFSDCCAGISLPLLQTLGSRLPRHPALVLSIGSGSGLLEGLLLRVSDGDINIYGVEVPPCVNKHLPDDHVLRVPCTASLHPDAMLATAFMFVYPRKNSLVAQYLDSFGDGALEQVVWLGHRSDWPEVYETLSSRCHKLELIEGPGLADYELLAVASVAQPEV